MLQFILILILICSILILTVIICADPRISLERKQPSLNLDGKILASSSLTKYYKKRRRSHSGKFIPGIRINSMNESKRKLNLKKTNTVSQSLFFLSPKTTEKQPDSSVLNEQSSTAVKSSGSNYYAILIKQIKVKSVSQYGVQ